MDLKMFRFILLGVFAILGLCAIVMNSGHYQNFKISQEMAYSNRENASQTNVPSQIGNITSEEQKTERKVPEETSTGVHPVISLSVEQAIAEFLKIYPETAITSIELEPLLGVYYYEIQGVDDHTEYSIKVNSSSGKVDKTGQEVLDIEDKNGRERSQEALSIDQLISVERAAQIAEEAAGGGKIEKWSLEKELSTTYWEVMVKNEAIEITVKIDAKNGTVLEVEQDD